MHTARRSALFLGTIAMLALTGLSSGQAEVRAWEGTITIPTYPWSDDANPRFWALDPGAKDGAPPLTALIYPYTMQDYLTRTKTDRTYKALSLENEYLKITCIPELGGRLHSVLDKTTGQDVFHLNHVIKPSMIAMRGGWISGGVEWNAGPQGHTVTCMSPVDALVGQNPDGSAYLEISNLEKTRRTRWTVRLTLHPEKAYLDERIRIFNPTDALSPYYFWNCTAFPNRPGTRFIFPMSLGTDHAGSVYYSWPVNEGRDMTWLKNYEIYTSIFAVQCTYDFFGAYDVDADRGLVQSADHNKLGGKKAWTWGQWDFGLVSEKNLTDDDGPYIEVQSGPLPTQSDYGALWPRDEISWQEWWYPVHSLGDGFEYATKDVALQTARKDGALELRIAATGVFPAATCTITRGQEELLKQTVDLSPDKVPVVKLTPAPADPVRVVIRAADNKRLATFDTPLPVPEVEPPTPPAWLTAADDDLSQEEACLKGRKRELAGDRNKARDYYELALESDAQCASAHRALGILDFEAVSYETARDHFEAALDRDPNDGVSAYFLGLCHFRHGDLSEALRYAYLAARSFGTAGLGYDLAGRVYMRMPRLHRAVAAFADAIEANPHDRQARDHWLIARYAYKDESLWGVVHQRVEESPTDLVPRALLALQGPDDLARFVHEARSFVGEIDFELLETGLTFAELGLFKEAAQLVQAVCVNAVPEAQRTALPLYYLAHWAAQRGDQDAVQPLLAQAAKASFGPNPPSRPAEVEILEFAVHTQPDDAQAHVQLGNLYAHLGWLDQAAAHWKTAHELKPDLSLAARNLGLYSRVVENDLAKAAAFYTQAITADKTDQTLYRDLAEILIAYGQRPEAIRVLESTPAKPMTEADLLGVAMLSTSPKGLPKGAFRRGDVIIALAQAYLDEQRFDDVIHLFESTPYFIAWEGQGTTWAIFNKAHLGRGKARFAASDFAGALADFEAALTYPANLGVGQPDKPEHAPAHYWRGRALQALGRTDDAKAAWLAGLSGRDGSPDQNKYKSLCGVALLTAR